MTKLLIGLIHLYRATLSLWLGPCCRFEPSCSTYGLEALRAHGFKKGTILILKRISRCRPGGSSGYDPVP